jgi:hypothetical protein
MAKKKLARPHVRKNPPSTTPAKSKKELSSQQKRDARELNRLELARHRVEESWLLLREIIEDLSTVAVKHCGYDPLDDDTGTTTVDSILLSISHCRIALHQVAATSELFESSAIAFKNEIEKRAGVANAS